MKQTASDVAIVGAGPAGLAAAVALAATGVSVALIGRAGGDSRTTALLASSVTALETLEVWQRCRKTSAPLKVMRIVDDTQRLWRAPEVRFSADEIGLEAFGWNIENRHLVDGLSEKARQTASLTWIEANAVAIDVDTDSATINTDGHAPITARLLVGADGRKSLCRAAARIDSGGWDYPQTAMAFNIRHSRPHDDISTEFHTAHGPFTLVPLPGLRSSLVWVAQPAEAQRIAALNEQSLAEEIERRSHSILGKIAVESGRGSFPLAIETAKSFAVHRVALVGEAAHALPPIGAQGFNLSLRDIATLAEFVATAHRSGSDPGGAEVTDGYNRTRQNDMASRKLAVDLLNRSLLSDMLAVQGLRGLGLYLLDRVGPLRRSLMREGVAPSGNVPRLMRGVAL